jgi:hypothetical protein
MQNGRGCSKSMPASWYAIRLIVLYQELAKNVVFTCSPPRTALLRRKINVKSSLFLAKHHTMKTYGGVEL